MRFAFYIELRGDPMYATKDMLRQVNSCQTRIVFCFRLSLWSSILFWSIGCGTTSSKCTFWAIPSVGPTIEQTYLFNITLWNGSAEEEAKQYVTCIEWLHVWSRKYDGYPSIRVIRCTSLLERSSICKHNSTHADTKLVEPRLAVHQTDSDINTILCIQVLRTG